MITIHKQFVLLSGGLDSSTALYHAFANPPAQWVDGERVDLPEAIGIDYGQRHSKELRHATQIAASLRAPFRVLRIPSGLLAGQMLTDPSQHIPEVSYEQLPDGISPTYVPFRNGLMLSMLAAHAQSWVNQRAEDERRIATIYIGAHGEDAARDAYPDCGEPFLKAMGEAIRIGTYKSVYLEAPFMGKTKADIVAKGYRLNVPFGLTWSCYKGEALHCGTCPTCRSRREAFKSAGVNDPTRYAAE